MQLISQGTNMHSLGKIGFKNVY